MSASFILSRKPVLMFFTMLSLSSRESSFRCWVWGLSKRLCFRERDAVSGFVDFLLPDRILSYFTSLFFCVSYLAISSIENLPDFLLSCFFMSSRSPASNSYFLANSTRFKMFYFNAISISYLMLLSFYLTEIESVFMLSQRSNNS